MMDFLKTFLFATFPPMDTDPRRRSFDIAVALALYALIFATLWGVGAMPRMFGQGYALAGDVAAKIDAQNQQMQTQARRLSYAQSVLLDIQVRAIRDDIRNNELMRCQILSDKRSDADLRARALDSTNRAIDQAALQFFQLTKQVYQQEPCEVLLIGRK